MTNGSESPSAAVFDMDGLIIDSEPVYKAAAQAASSALGFAFSDDFYLSMVGLSRTQCEALMFEHFGADYPMDAFNARWPDAWNAQLDAHGMRVMPGFDAAFAAIESRGLRYAIATSSDAGRAARSLEAAGLAGRFDIIVTGDQVENAKPAPDIYLLAASRLGVDPTRCVALEDSTPGATAALAAGMRVFLVPDMAPPGPAVASRVHGVLDTLAEVPAALDALFTV